MFISLVVEYGYALPVYSRAIHNNMENNKQSTAVRLHMFTQNKIMFTNFKRIPNN